MANKLRLVLQSGGGEEPGGVVPAALLWAWQDAPGRLESAAPVRTGPVQPSGRRLTLGSGVRGQAG